MASLLSTSPDRVKTPLRIDLPLLGTLRPRSAAEIGPTNWTLGCETLDRDFADWDEYRDYIAPLGLQSIRLQAGWAKCERVRGVYDFAWLDHIVDDALALGLSPLLETGYGNPVYPGGGGFDLGAGFPTSDEGLAAWDAWVDAITRHFAGRVRDWAMWNEPDIRPTDGSEPKTPKQIAAFNARTARIVKRSIPEARIAGLSLASSSPELLEQCLLALGPDAVLFDWFIYHGYQSAPESSYANVEALKEVVARLAPHAQMRQGENGCPSEMATRFALSNIPWSEFSQAKWDMRRMLGDLGHDVPSSVFTVCDFNHKGREINIKGLLRANADKKVIAVKRAYYAVQNVANVFDASLTRVPDSGFRTRDWSLSTYEYRKPDGRPLFVFWTHGARRNEEGLLEYQRPGDSFETRPVAFDWIGAPLRDPVWIDLLTGRVHAFANEDQLVHSAGVTFVNVPVYDSPCVLTEKSAVSGRFLETSLPANP